jgi:preprotein translocase subunit SecE
VARNRKRANQRRRSQPVTARPGKGALPGDGRPAGEDRGAPDPLAHAAPDVELAEAQLIVGQPLEELDSPEDERALAELATAGASSGAEPGARGENGDGESGGAENGGGESVGAVAATRTRAGTPAPRPNPLVRLSTFVQGCWAELQRVQWPDRRQVMQATGVVIGFVIVAGLFLGVADWAAGHIVDFILK